MRDGFRFPKTTAVLMTIIPGRRGDGDQDGRGHCRHHYSDTGGQIGPIHPVAPHLLLAAIPTILVSFYAMGLACWAILFALRRSGVHRLAEMSGEPK